MNAAKMTQVFARGGPEAQKSFKTVVQAISKVKDPVKQNAIAVGLFGTQAEDLEKNVIAAMGTASRQFNMTKNTMDDINNVKYDTFGNAIKGIGRQFVVGVISPIEKKVLPIIQKLANGISSKMPFIQKIVTATFNKMGTGIDKAQKIFSKLVQYIAPVIKSILGIIMPILIDAANFIQNIWGQLLDFWNENGSQIMSAVKNVFSGLAKIIQFLAPVILFILTSVWSNVKGVIQGALNIILGAVKIFASIFTGDWSGLWEGIKQYLRGTLQFLWNLWNLLLVGKLVGSIKTLATAFWTFLKGLGTRISTNIQYYHYMFVNGFYRIGSSILRTIGNAFMAVFNILKTGVMNCVQIFTTARTFGVNIFMSMISVIRNIFATIFSAIRATVVNTFTSISGAVSGSIGFIRGIIGGFWGNLVNIFNQAKTVMASPFQYLQSVVSSVTGSISGIVSGMFSGVVTTGRGAINSLISAANAVIGNLNGLSVDIPDWVPKVGGKSFSLSIPKIPMLAKGGITTGPTLAMIGEGAEQEAVLPLSRLEALLGGAYNQQDQIPSIVFSPQYKFEGTPDKSTIESVVADSYQQFKQMMDRYLSDRNRKKL